MSKRQLTILILVLLPLTACMSTKVGFHPEWQPRSKPVYTDYFDYYWWGFSGQNEVDLQKVCMDQKIHGLQIQRTFEDWFLAGITLGIYTPITVKVWCGENK